MNDQGRTPQSISHERDQDETSFLASIAEWLRRGLGKGEETTWQETVEEFIHEKEDVAQRISDEERSLLFNLLRFGNLTAEEVMVPRSDIIALPENSTLDETVALLKQAGHSRMPVYRGTLDEVIGLVHVRDVVAYWGEAQAFIPKNLMREILFVPPSMPILNLLGKMRQTRLHMAVVVDEYGGTDGLVTIEDIVEEIVGEIEDEHDDNESSIIELPDGAYDMEGRVPLELVQQKMGLVFNLSDELDDIDTLGGLTTSLAGRVPKRGEVLNCSSELEILVLDADPRRVKRLRVRKMIKENE